MTTTETNPANGRFLSYSAMLQLVTSHMPGLDGLRGFAIIWVVCHMSCGDFSLTDVFSKIASLVMVTGWAGVQLFFVLSGFLITGILLDSKDKPKRWRTFYIRRALRIFPIYYGVLIVAFLIYPLFAELPPEFRRSQDIQIMLWSYTTNWAYLFGGAGGFSHFWSLAVEEQFYLIWPLFVFYLHWRTLFKISLALIIIAYISRVLFVVFMPDDYSAAIYESTICRMDALIMGATLAIMLRKETTYRWLTRYSFHLTLFTIVSLIAMLLIDKNLGPTTPGLGLFHQSLFALLFTLGIFYILQPASNVSALWKHFSTLKILNHLGKYSYAIYIFHLPLRSIWNSTFFVSPDGHGGLTLWLILMYNSAGVFTAAYICARISWLLLERPALKLKDRFSYSDRTTEQFQTQEQQVSRATG